MPAILTILGSSAALPSNNRNLSSHLLETDATSFLFDCGEGTQFQLKKYKKKIHRITAIFISHLHGDHFFGLPGLLSSMHMLDRIETLTIYGPVGLKEVIWPLFTISGSVFNYLVEFVEISTSTKIELLQTAEYTIFTFPLKHKIPTFGFMYLKSSLGLNIKKDFVKSQQIPKEWYARIKNGENYIDSNGVEYLNSEITAPAKKRIFYAYCSDTLYFEGLAEWVKGVSVLYHESTFLNEHQEDAANKMHSTAQQAASVAKAADVGQLLLGHYSARYKSIEEFKIEAKQIFESSKLAIEGLEIKLAK